MAAQSEQDDNIWAGYIDALTTMTMIMTLVMVILGVCLFGLSQSVPRSIFEKLGQAANLDFGDRTETSKLASELENWVRLHAAGPGAAPYVVPGNERPQGGPARANSELAAAGVTSRPFTVLGWRNAEVESAGSGNKAGPPLVDVEASGALDQSQPFASRPYGDRLAAVPGTALDGTGPLPQAGAAETGGAPGAIGTVGGPAEATVVGGSGATALVPGGMGSGGLGSGGVVLDAPGSITSGGTGPGADGSGTGASGSGVAGTGNPGTGNPGSGGSAVGEAVAGQQPANPGGPAEAVAPQTAPVSVAEGQGAKESTEIVSRQKPDRAPPKAGSTVEVNPLVRPAVTIRFEGGAVRLDDQSMEKLKAALQGGGLGQAPRLAVTGIADLTGSTVTDARRTAYYRVIAVRQAMASAGVPVTAMRMGIVESAGDDGDVVTIARDE